MKTDLVGTGSNDILCYLRVQMVKVKVAHIRRVKPLHTIVV